MKKTYTQSAGEVLRDLGVGAEGLTTAQAQVSKADAAIEALQTMTAATCKVLRDGKMLEALAWHSP